MKLPKEVNQFMESFSEADAIGYHALGIHHLLIKNDIRSNIYSDNIHFKKLKPSYKKFDEYFQENHSQSVVNIVHYSIFWKKLDKIKKMAGRKLLIFHNITPPEYFSHDKRFQSLLQSGYKQLNEMSSIFDQAICVSNFNKKILQNHGFKKPVDVIPPFVNLDRKFSKFTNQKVNRDEKTKIIYVGKFAPHKCQEEIVNSFKTYNRLYNNNSELYLIGGYNPNDNFYNLVKAAVSNQSKIKITGKIPLKSLVAHYQTADVFLSLSEHEGFGVPLIESMYFNLPIVAYSAAAVPSTVQSGGILLKEKYPLLVGATINELVENKTLNKKIIKNQQEELERFNYSKIEKKILKCLAKN
jgi:L-malate glycosyltransferase